MPQIKAFSKLKTLRAVILDELAREFAKYLKLSNKDYRKLKSTGKAHTWQQKISKGYYNEIDFNAISGKALRLLVSSKFLANHKLEKRYLKWLKSKDNIKFNGYPYELLNTLKKYNYSPDDIIKYTVDKQFNTLVDTAKSNDGGIKGNVWVAVDTSGSMTWETAGNTTAYDVCISLAVFFSEMNEGTFHNHIIMFDDVSKVKKLTGNSFSERVKQIMKSSTAWGSTNFQSVIDEIVRIRKQFPHIPVEDYPETLLVISDMQFNIASKKNRKTNYEKAMQKLRAVGLPDMKIIWWQVSGSRVKDFPSTLDDKGTYFFSGFDGSIISTLLGMEVKEQKSTSMEDVFLNAMNQEILSQLKVVD
jgi:uncharacterized protein with von Willebrand factor type A (vWA) domain